MRKFLILTLSVLTAAPALAWVPKLEETTAKTVIDSAYGRRTDPVLTYLNVDLSVQDGAFKSGKAAVNAFDGGEQCVADWLAKPTDYTAGSRPTSLTLSGQADQLFFQAQQARDSFKSLTPADALKDTASRLPDGQLRLDVGVAGLPSQQQRSAYLVRMRGPDGKLIAPVKSSYVNDWKPMNGAASATPSTPSTPASAQGPYAGTLVYYFEPLKAGLPANAKVDILIRTEADTTCAYAVPMDLSSFY
ncbi:hypothetical protein [Deinococcus sonorensis]|uniref:Uncharacterized protein n=2 Tax=Deinococcus sonorensis TaxID=309891 RepID=A0AAU7U8T0_9DEIO